MTKYPGIFESVTRGEVTLLPCELFCSFSLRVWKVGSIRSLVLGSAGDCGRNSTGFNWDIFNYMSIVHGRYLSVYSRWTVAGIIHEQVSLTMFQRSKMPLVCCELPTNSYNLRNYWFQITEEKSFAFVQRKQIRYTVHEMVISILFFVFSDLPGTKLVVSLGSCIQTV